VGRGMGETWKRGGVKWGSRERGENKNKWREGGARGVRRLEVVAQDGGRKDTGVGRGMVRGVIREGGAVLEVKRRE